MCIKINRKVAFLIQYSRTKRSKCCCHPSFHPPIFCRHSSKLLSSTLPKLMNGILLSPPPLSSDPDNPPKFGMCTRWVINTSLVNAFTSFRKTTEKHIRVVSVIFCLCRLSQYCLEQRSLADAFSNFQ